MVLEFGEGLGGVAGMKDRIFGFGNEVGIVLHEYSIQDLYVDLDFWIQVSVSKPCGRVLARFFVDCSPFTVLRIRFVCLHQPERFINCYHR